MGFLRFLLDLLLFEILAGMSAFYKCFVKLLMDPLARLDLMVPVAGA